MKRTGMAWAATLWLATTATGAHAAEAMRQAQKPCVPPAEAEALFLLIAPELLRTAGQTCAAELPANALLRDPNSALIRKYQGESEGAWPLAREAMIKISGPEARAAMETAEARPLVVSMMSAMLAGKINPADCQSIDRVLGYLEPLPARNLSGLLITIVELTQRGKSGGEKKRGPYLDICPPAGG
jgi:hypothetical protein